MQLTLNHLKDMEITVKLVEVLVVAIREKKSNVGQTLPSHSFLFTWY